MQESGTTAGLRGIYSVDGKVAWASGTGGTVLRTTDGGAHWTKCAVPDGDKDGATLDFRGVQAWNEKTAVVMASGPGDKSRLYKTADGCANWSLLSKNPEKDGFWDAIAFKDELHGYLLGDPVNGRFVVLHTSNGGSYWPDRIHDPAWTSAYSGEGAFAASNSSLLAPDKYENGTQIIFGGGGAKGSRVVFKTVVGSGDIFSSSWGSAPVPLASGASSTGLFSLAQKDVKRLTAVGGDYTKPNESSGTAAWSSDGGKTWTASITPPHGYRSSVQWSESLKAWITVGTNGSDISHDDGKTWSALEDPIMANGNWNALSLPFVVGPNGRIARLAIAGK
jgi:photosystem II stability/assembly factor-like uncharacterized protein